MDNIPMGLGKLTQKAEHLAETLELIDENLASPMLAEEDRELIVKSRGLFDKEHAEVRADIELLMAHKALSIAKLAA